MVSAPLRARRDGNLEALTPPHSLEAEQSLLGALLIDGTAWDQVADVVRCEDFYRPDHRLIFEALAALVAEHRPGEIAVERVFVSRNADSALKLGQARGAALCAIPAGMPVFEYAPRAVKLAVVGFGGAEKFQVARMVCTLLALAEAPGADAADALAVAVCHAHLRAQQQLLQDAAQRCARA